MDYAYQHLDWRERANRLAQEKRMDELFRELMLAVNGDVEQALDYLEELSQRYRQDLGFDRRDFENRLREQKLIAGAPGSRALTKRGERALRAGCLDAVFGKLKAGPRGEHIIPRPGAHGEPSDIMRPWQPGDESYDIQYRESMLGALRAGHRQLEHGDLVVQERDQSTSAATVMLIDVSHSMTLYGEDRITPAKRVAMAFAELQARRHPRDSLNILLFGDDVQEVTVQELPYISNGPFHTNTCEALRRAAEILAKKHQLNKRVVMITDGKPTALFCPRPARDGRRQLTINSSYGLDPEIVTATLRQGARYPRLKIELNIFMVASDPYLERFVTRLVEVSHGRAFRATLGDLGDQVLTRIFGKSR
jgi:Ca-activated chloride channel family protein